MPGSPDGVAEPSTCDRDLFREVIGHFMTGVTVITTTDAGRDYGMSASAVSSLSLDPPMLLCCLNEASPTQQAVSRARIFCVNILAEEQHELAKRFGRSGPDKFVGVPTERGALGAPVLTGALACLQCRVDSDVVGGTHRVFLGRVAHAQARDGTPLAYFRGGFGRVELAANARAYAAIREQVVVRRLSIDTPIDIGSLAAELELPRSHVFQALLALEAEGLISRNEGHEFLVVPVDRPAAEQTFDARKALELAAAELTVGRLRAEQLAELRRQVERTSGLIVDGHFSDVETYVQANADLHECLVGLAENQPLLESYRRLSIPSMMIRLFTHYDRADDSLLDEHREIVAAYEAGDLDRARMIIRVHSDHAKILNDAALAAHGGRI